METVNIECIGIPDKAVLSSDTRNPCFDQREKSLRSSKDLVHSFEMTTIEMTVKVFQKVLYVISGEDSHSREDRG